MTGAKNYRVTAQRRTEALSPGGTFEPVVQVSIITDTGTPATFDFSDVQYTAQNVENTIEEWIARHDAVAAIGNS